MTVYGLQKLYIGGAYVDATSGNTFDTFDPATGEVLATRSSRPARPTSSAPWTRRARASACGRR